MSREGASRSRFTIATNRGDIGGGEVMLLELAASARELGLSTRVVGPTCPDAVVVAAGAAGHDVVAVEAPDRPGYARALRRWHRSERHQRLWCNGLVPALATAARANRVVHLHQAPTRRQRPLADLAVLRAEAVVVPSFSMGAHVPHHQVMANWTAQLDRLPARTPPARPVIGYLGRLQTDKGVDVLARACTRLVQGGLDLDLVVAGGAGFGNAADITTVDAALTGLGTRVHRLGTVDRSAFFADVDLAVFPSVWAEPFGLVVAEAMAFGVPFVISDAGALPEVAGPEHPWIARAGDVDDLARVIQAALTTDPRHRTEIIDRARLRWEREFSPTAGRARFAQLLRKVGYDVPAGVGGGAS